MRSAALRALGVRAMFLGVLTGLLLLVGSAPALAASQRGHVFSFAFGDEGESRLSHPSGIAVNDATGDVYVADHNNDRVDEFATEENGEPILNVKGERTGKLLTTFKVPFPESVAVDDCTVEPTPGKPEACASTVDPSVGDVYVVGATAESAKEEEPTNFIVYKFSPEGKLITKIKKFTGTETNAEDKTKHIEPVEFEEQISGVAVDASGTLFVDQGSEGFIYKFNDGKVNKGKTRVKDGFFEEASRPGLAVDAEGQSLYVAGAPDPEEEDGNFAELAEDIAAEDEAAGLRSERFAAVGAFEAADGLTVDPALDFEDSTAVAVNQLNEPANQVKELGDVYVANLSFPAGKEQTTIAEFSPSTRALVQRFTVAGLEEATGIAVDDRTGVVYAADAKANKVDVFTLQQSGPPTVEDLSSCTEGGNPTGCPKEPSATDLIAELNPDGAETTYEFQYGTESCASEPSPCTAIAGHLAAGFGNVAIGAVLPPGLASGLYHYRLVAKNEFAPGEVGSVASAEQTFTVLPPPSELPDGRAYELVSPAKKNGEEPELITEELGGGIRASANGNALAYIADGPIPAGVKVEGSRDPEPTQILATRDPEGNEWISQDISTPNDKGAGILVGSAEEYQLFSSNLSLSLVQPFQNGIETPESAFAEPPLSPPLSENEKNLAQAKQPYLEKTFYLRADQPIEPEATERQDYEEAKQDGEGIVPKNAGFLPLVSELSAPAGQAFGGKGPPGEQTTGVQSVTATPNLSYGVFKSAKAESGIYEWGPEHEAQPKPVSLLPGEPASSKPVPASAAAVGGPGETDVDHAISNDGTFVFWTSEATHHLYVRDTSTEETLQLDEVQAKASGAGPQFAVFQTASANGAKVFFTDTQQLTANSKAAELLGRPKPDLYVAELSGGRPGEGKLTVTVTDLTPEGPEGTEGESADIVVAGIRGGGVLGASEEEAQAGEEEQSYVYFVANGVLAPGATRGDCSEEDLAAATCNLYVRHFEGGKWAPTKLVAKLSTKDSPDWGDDVAGDRSFVTSRVSPSGEYLAFMSDEPLTGYDNVDKSARAKGARDEEVFEYDAKSERLTCVSCNPTGEQPEGIFDTGTEKLAGEPEHEGRDLLVDRSAIWAEESNETVDHWLAANVPGWTPEFIERALYQPRYLLNNGRVFFDSPDHLVPAAHGNKEKVYEFEPGNVGDCHSGSGCIGLLSQGDSAHEAAFVEASTSGNDVFFLSADQLVSQDVDTNFDIYDARLCEALSPCLKEPAAPKEACKTAEACREGSGFSKSSFMEPASAARTGTGNLAQGVLPTKETAKPQSKPKPPTRAQLLAEALKACKKDKKKSKRVACERQAHKKYSTKQASKAKKSSRRGAR